MGEFGVGDGAVRLGVKMTVSDFGSVLGLWLRRLVCIFGGGATAVVMVFLKGIFSHRPLDDGFYLWGCSIAGAVGAIVGTLIVFRAERQETKKKLEARKRCIPSREALWLEINS
jgi:hypothetical protein